MISIGKKLWHYLAVKKLSVLSRRIASKNNGEFNGLNCLYSFRTKNRLEQHKRVSEHTDFRNVIMLSEDSKILEFHQYQKSDNASFIIYSDFECITAKIDGCKNNPGNSSTIKVSEHIPSGFLMSTISSFRSMKNKHEVYRCKNWMKKFSEYLRERAMKIINLKNKKNKIIKKRAAEIIQKYKNILHL